MADAITAETLLDFFKETRDLFRETELRMQETDRRMQETDRRMQETDRRMQETDRKIKEVSTLVGNLSNRLGEFVEDMVEPAVLRLFQERGIEVHQIFRNAKASRDGETIEVDLLAVNGNELVAVECKSKLSVEHIQEHVDLLGKIRKMFPQWAEHKIYGAVASMVLDESTVRYAERCGLFVIVQSGEAVTLRNPKDFQPRNF